MRATLAISDEWMEKISIKETHNQPDQTKMIMYKRESTASPVVIIILMRACEVNFDTTNHHEEQVQIIRWCTCGCVTNDVEAAVVV